MINSPEIGFLAFVVYICYICFLFLFYRNIRIYSLQPKFGNAKLIKKIFLNNQLNFSWVKLIFFSLIYTFIFIFVGKDKAGTHLDRSLYLDRYLQQIPMDVLGLEYIAEISRLLSEQDTIVFLFLVSIICSLLLFLAIKSSKNVSWTGILLFLSSSILMDFLYLFKQSIAISLSSIAIILFVEGNFKKKLLAYLFSMTAFFFHETSLIVLIFFIFTYFVRFPFFKTISIISLLIIYLNFNFLYNLLINSHPFLYENFKQFTIFLSNETYSQNTFHILKFTPFYVLSFYLYFRRHVLKNLIDKFETYFLMSLLVSFLSLLSNEIYWVYRLSLYFYLPLLLFAGRIYLLDSRYFLTQLFFLFSVLFFFMINLRFLFMILVLKGGF